jgi:hypothetical protein
VRTHLSTFADTTSIIGCLEGKLEQRCFAKDEGGTTLAAIFWARPGN